MATSKAPPPLFSQTSGYRGENKVFSFPSQGGKVPPSQNNGVPFPPPTRTKQTALITVTQPGTKDPPRSFFISRELEGAFSFPWYCLFPPPRETLPWRIRMRGFPLLPRFGSVLVSVEDSPSLWRLARSRPGCEFIFFFPPFFLPRRKVFISCRQNWSSAFFSRLTPRFYRYLCLLLSIKRWSQQR